MNAMEGSQSGSISGIAPKTNFAVDSKLEPYYTGGKIKLTNDGKSLFCACDADVKMIDVSTGKEMKTIKGENDAILNFALSSDDEILVTSHSSGLMKEWDWKEEKVVKTWRGTHKGPISCMTFDSTTTLLATGGTDSTVKVWDIVHQYITHNLKGCQGVLSVVEYHPEAERWIVFGAANDYKIRAWDLNTSECVALLEGHLSTVTCLAFTNDLSRMLSGGRDKVVILWDISEETMTSLRTIPVFEAVESVIPILMNEALPDLGVEDINSICFITAGSKGVLRAWSDRGKLLHTQKQPVVLPGKELDENDGGLVLTHAFYNEAIDTIVVVTFEHNILFYKLRNFKLEKQLVGYNDDILDITYFGQNDSHFAVATNSCNIKVFEVTSLDCKLLRGHTNMVLALATFPSNPLMMASASKDSSVRIWLMDATVKDISCIAIGQGHTHDVGSVTCSRLKANFLVTGSNDTCLKLWKLPKEVTKTTTESVSPMSVKWTQVAHEKDVNFVCISPNDRLLASCSSDKLGKVWNAVNGTLLGTLRGHRRGLWSVQFSPIDQVVASSSADGMIKIWSLKDFSCVKTFEGHECSVLKVLFLSRGMQLLSSSSDGLIKLWTIKLNECIKTLDGHNGKVWALNTNQSESAFISGASDSNIIVWKDVTEIEKTEQRETQERLIEEEQELQNLLQQKKFSKALQYCIRLEQPFRALNIVKELLLLPDGREQLDTAMKGFRDDQIDTLLRFAATWNTNSKNCYEAQHILNIVLKTYSSEDLLKFSNIQSIVQGFLPYTERHYQRCNKLLQQATFIDYTWQRMKMSEQVQSDN